MVFKFLALFNMLTIALVAAGGYRYSQLNSQNDEITQGNKLANDINSLNGTISVDDKEDESTKHNSERNALNSQADIKIEQKPFATANTPVDDWPPAMYQYDYAVNDANTGDIKSHTETRDGNSVRGFYSVVDPDGFERIVTYTADDVYGFNAVVRRKPYVLKISKSTSLDHLPMKDASTTATNMQDSNHNDLPIQRRNSYASPPTSQQQSNDPYHLS